MDYFYSFYVFSFKVHMDFHAIDALAAVQRECHFVEIVVSGCTGCCTATSWAASKGTYRQNGNISDSVYEHEK